MIAIGHTSIGAVLAIALASVTSGLPLSLVLSIIFVVAVLSHYVADWIPHGHYHVRYKDLSSKTIILATLDGVLSLIPLGIALAHFGLSPMFFMVMVAVAGAQLPDFFEGAVHVGLIPQWKWVRMHHHFHIKRMHWHSSPLSNVLRLPRPIRLSDAWLAGLFLSAVFVLR